MSNIDLTKYGIFNAKEIIRNPSYEFLGQSGDGSNVIKPAGERAESG